MSNKTKMLKGIGVTLLSTAILAACAPNNNKQNDQELDQDKKLEALSEKENNKTEKTESKKDKPKIKLDLSVNKNEESSNLIEPILPEKPESVIKLDLETPLLNLVNPIEKEIKDKALPKEEKEEVALPKEVDQNNSDIVKEKELTPTEEVVPNNLLTVKETDSASTEEVEEKNSLVVETVIPNNFPVVEEKEIAVVEEVVPNNLPVVEEKEIAVVEEVVPNNFPVVEEKEIAVVETVVPNNFPVVEEKEIAVVETVIPNNFPVVEEKEIAVVETVVPNNFPVVEEKEIAVVETVIPNNFPVVEEKEIAVVETVIPNNFPVVEEKEIAVVKEVVPNNFPVIEEKEIAVVEEVVPNNFPVVEEKEVGVVEGDNPEHEVSLDDLSPEDLDISGNFKPITPNRIIERKTVVVPFIGEEIIEDENMFEGEERIEPGVNGSYVEAIVKENGVIISTDKENLVEPIKAKKIIGKKKLTSREEEIVELPFKTIRKESSDLFIGEEKVEQEGISGSFVKVTTTNHKTGEKTITEENHISPINKIILLGTKELTNKTEKVIKVPFKEIIKESDSLYIGEEKIETVGVEGHYTEVTTIDQKTNKKTVTKINNTPPINQVKLIGTKERYLVKEEVIKIPFNRRTEYTDQLFEGERKVSQVGVEGKYTKIITIDQKTNKETYSEKNRINPIEEVMLIGNKKLLTITEEVIEIPFTTEERRTDSLFVGETKVEVKPQKGRYTKVTTINNKTGKKTYSEKDRVEPINKVVLIGTKDRYREESITKPIPNRIIEEKTDSLFEGEFRVKVQGNPGEVRITKRIDQKTGIATTKEEILIPAVDQILLVGTKKVWSVTELREDIQYNTVEKVDDQLFEGERIVKQKGKNGYRIKIINQNNKTGDRTEEIKKTVDPVEEIILIGKRKIFTTTIVTRELPITEEVREDYNLPIGERRILYSGTPGTVDIEIKRNNKTGETTETELVIRQGSPRVILVGTKETSANDRLLLTEDVEIGKLRGNYIPTDLSKSPEIDLFEVYKLSPEERYIRALDNQYNNANYLGTAKDGTGYWRVSLGMGDRAVDLFNQGVIIDHDLINQEFLNYVNNFRIENGKKPITYSKEVLGINSDIRAEELSTIGSIRKDKNKPHTRLDLRPWDTVFDETGTKHYYTVRGENLALFTLKSNPYAYLSEKYIAEKFFEIWKNSPGHRANLLEDHYEAQAISVRMSTIDNSSHRSPSNVVIGVQLFGGHW